MSTRRWRCLLCRDAEHPFGIDFDSPAPQCPVCKAGGPLAITPVEIIHLYAPDPSNGPILGMHGKRYRVACKANATNPRGVPCTLDPRVVTCPDCVRTKDFQTARDLIEKTLAGGEIL